MTAVHRELPNGYTVSVINHGYGSNNGLLEMACWETVSGEWAMDRPPFVNNDVLGWLSPEEVSANTDEIANWPAIS